MRKDSHEQCNCRSCERTNAMFEEWYMQTQGPISGWQFLGVLIAVIFAFMCVFAWLSKH